VRFHLTTNGTLLDADRATFLAAHRARMRLSFDGVPVAQDLRAAGTFARLDGLLDRLRREQSSFFLDHLEVAVTLTAANLPALPASVAYFLRKGVRTVRVSPRLTPDPDLHADHVADLDRQVSRVFATSLAHFRATGQVPVTFLRRTEGAPPDPGPYRGWTCGIADGSSLCVDVDGQVTGCALLAASCQSFPGALAERLRPMRLGSILDADLPRRLASQKAPARAAGLFHRRERKTRATGPAGGARAVGECRVCPLCAAHVPGNGTRPRPRAVVRL
jgi:sulfatase maturation enzyme AslB (radical SAM superfamily)